PLLSDPGAAADQINAAIAAATRGHVPRLVTPDMLTGVGWVLTAALFMDAKWARPFDPSKTTEGVFTTAAGQQVTARYMNGGSFPVGAAEGWTGVRLACRGGSLAMIALLPPAGAGACAVPGPALARRLAGAPPPGGPVPGPVRLARVSLPKVS